MPSWNDLLAELAGQPDDAAKAAWTSARLQRALVDVGVQRGGRNVILYGSAFLQKPLVPAPFIQLTHEELNGFMAVIYGMDVSKGLTLILHTPGGVTNAAETIVSYLRSKFADIEVIVPAIAMSAGTMIALSADRIIMGRQSQLGPIDPQLPFVARYVSARAIVDQFDRAKGEVAADVNMAHVWAPILATLGPSLLQEAQNALDYGERMVAQWLADRQFKGRPDAITLAEAAARHFGDASKHKSHGRRIDRDEARGQQLVVEDLEPNPALQDAVLTAYHMMTIVCDNGPAAKVVASDAGRNWVKNVPVMRQVAGPAP